MNNWKKEIELIDNLGLLYPIISGWYEYDKNWTNKTKAYWIRDLCIYHLNQQLPQLEEFIKKNTSWAWSDYKEHFNIK